MQVLCTRQQDVWELVALFLVSGSQISNLPRSHNYNQDKLNIFVTGVASFLPHIVPKYVGF